MCLPKQTRFESEWRTKRLKGPNRGILQLPASFWQLVGNFNFLLIFEGSESVRNLFVKSISAFYHCWDSPSLIDNHKTVEKESAVIIFEGEGAVFPSERNLTVLSPPQSFLNAHWLTPGKLLKTKDTKPHPHCLSFNKEINYEKYKKCFSFRFSKRDRSKFLKHGKTNDFKFKTIPLGLKSRNRVEKIPILISKKRGCP